MKKYRNLFFVTLVGLFLLSCQSMQDGLTLKKKENHERKKITTIIEQEAIEIATGEFCNNKKFLVVGLGNIGEEYKNTRHNIGFDIVDQLGIILKGTFNSAKY